ncbi:hypothetical protein TSOC_014771, partial [Tetrabaena socialis]
MMVEAPKSGRKSGLSMFCEPNFDLRVLVVMGPGRRAWLHRTLYLRVATAPLADGDLSRQSQCTNISQGGAVMAVTTAQDLPGYDKVLRNLCITTRSVISAMYDVLPSENAIHYFGFDYMLDEQLAPWLLEVNSTPRLVNCNATGAVHEALLELLCEVVEPSLDGRPLAAPGGAGGWLQEQSELAEKRSAMLAMDGWVRAGSGMDVREAAAIAGGAGTAEGRAAM